MLQSMGSQRVRHDWVTELNWTVTWSVLKCYHQHLICRCEHMCPLNTAALLLLSKYVHLFNALLTDLLFSRSGSSGFHVLHYLLELAQIHVLWVMPSNQLILCSPFSFSFQSFPVSGSLPVSQLFTSGGQSIGTSALASVHSRNVLGWFPLGLTCLIFLQSRDSQKSSPAQQFKSINSSVLSLHYGPTLISTHDFWKNHRRIFVRKVMSLFFNTLSRFVIAFLPKSKCLLLTNISW